MTLHPAIAVLTLSLAAAWLPFLAAAPPTPAAAPASNGSTPPPPLLERDAVGALRLHLRPDALDRLRTAPRTWVPARLAGGPFPEEDLHLHLKGRVGSFQPIDADRPAFTLDLGPEASSRRFPGWSRVHLNNALEDPTLLQQLVAAAVFRDAGVPAPRAAHARVELNGRPLGVYVLVEGFTPEFLREQGLDPEGLLGEAESGGDLDSPITIKSPPAHRGERFPVDDLLAALREPDLSTRYSRLVDRLDTERFLTFLALEVILGHRDGYGLARNNYRLYRDPASGRSVFLPHGLDQLFGNPALPWKPAFAGQVARAFLETPEGRRRYEERFRELHRTWLASDTLPPRVEQAFAALRPSLSAREREAVTAATADLQDRIRERARNVAEQLARPTPPPPAWDGDSLALTHWTHTDPTVPAPPDSPNAPSALHLAADSPTSASWRCRLPLAPGRYRFLARARVDDVSPLPFGRAQGAGLRLGGQSRGGPGLLGTTDWTPLELVFEVPEGAEETELVAELRARTGQAWFERQSLRLVRLPGSLTARNAPVPRVPGDPRDSAKPVFARPSSSSLAGTAPTPIP